MRRKLMLFCLTLVIGMVTFQSCKKESTIAEPPQVGVFFSIADKQAAFTALTLRATTWLWDFGDGTTSTEKNPVHVYKDGGYYVAKLIGKNAQGDTASYKVKLAVALTPYDLLTGDHTMAGYQGKTWKISSTASGGLFANADAEFSLAADPLGAGIFGNLGLGEIYDDTFTFNYNGSYSHDVKADHASFGGIVNQYLTNGGSGIVNSNGSDYGLCTAKYTPQVGAKFTLVNKENLTVPSVYGSNGTVTYSNVSTLDFTGTEFIGFMDRQRKIIVRDITDSSMKIVMFMAADPDNFPKNTHAIILAFDVVR
jgi:PKD repeat protein